MHKLLFAIASVLPAIAQSGPVVIGRLSPDGQIVFQSYEVFTANGRDSVRILTDSDPMIDERVYGRLPRVKLSLAGTLRREGNLIVQLPESGIVLPDQLRFKGAQKIEDVWAGVAFAGKLNRKDAEEIAFNPQEFFALIPGAGAEAAVAFVLNPSNFKSLDERLAVIRGVAASFPKAEVARLQVYLEDELNQGLARFESGGPYAALLETLKYAATAETAFPQAQQILQTTRALRERKSWVDAAVVNLQSLYNAGRWDDFLDKYVPFERYQGSFPKMAHNLRRAFRESARLHVQRGRDLSAGKSYVEASREFRIALQRDPLNRPLQDLAEEKRIEASLAIARQKGTHKGLGNGSPQEVRFNRHLSYASRFIADKKFMEAEQEIKAAAELDRDSPGVLLVRAKLLNARSELTQALMLLDTYDESVIDPAERRAGEEVRVEVAYNLNKLKAENKAALSRLYQERQYREALALAAKSVELDRQDSEFLYYSGLLSAVLRKNATAGEHLQSYLKVSNSVAADPKRRELSLRTLSILQTAQSVPSSGSPNWFSGRGAEPDVFYCPESLAFQPKIAAIRADRQEQTFEWTQDGRLAAISSASTPGSYFFEYFETAPQVVRIGEGKSDSGTNGLSVILPSSPVFNMEVLALVEGPAAVGFAPNPYFNPFVWTGIHAFRFSYDKLGRVESAAEIGAPRLARFTWDDERLQSIAVFATAGDTERPVYRRTMTYTADKLMSETVDYGGKQYRITYKYVGGKLTEAAFEDTGAHDGVERRVRFL